MSKVYEVLSGLSPQLREEVREILDAMLASGDIVNWDRQHRLMLDNRSLPKTNIVDLVAHLLHPGGGSESVQFVHANTKIY